MNYKELNRETWSLLKSPDYESGGYPSITLELEANKSAFLHLFKDRSGYYHFAIEASCLQAKDITKPSVNGLKIQLVNYRFHDGPITQFIDLTCSISGYIEEFTQIVREISESILLDKEKPYDAVNQTINTWISFWSNKRKETLSEEEQIGLICELITLNKLCNINSGTALKTWIGPLGEKHDFNFSDWNFEVKGTRNSKRIHTINGIDQLDLPPNKSLAFISFQLTTSNNEHSINLPNLIKSIIKNHFENKPDLTVTFNELLSGAGYSPVHNEEYKKFNVEILGSMFYNVDESFPKLTSSNLNEPLNSRITDIRYKISLEGLSGVNLNDLKLGNYFF